jgi:hypothetical protein
MGRRPRGPPPNCSSRTTASSGNAAQDGLFQKKRGLAIDFERGVDEAAQAGASWVEGTARCKMPPGVAGSARRGSAGLRGKSTENRARKIIQPAACDMCLGLALAAQNRRARRNGCTYTMLANILGAGIWTKPLPLLSQPPLRASSL